MRDFEINTFVDSLNLDVDSMESLKSELTANYIRNNIAGDPNWYTYPYTRNPIRLPDDLHNCGYTSDGYSVGYETIDMIYKSFSKYDLDFKRLYETYDERQVKTLNDVWSAGEHYEFRKKNKTAMDAWKRYHNLYRSIIDKEPLDELTTRDLVSQIIHHKNNSELKEAWDIYYSLILIA